MRVRPRASSAARTFSPVPTGTVLFITTIASASSGISSTTVQTAERSASPECVADVQREGEPFRVAREQVVEAGLVDRHLALPEALDPARHDVSNDDLVAQ